MLGEQLRREACSASLSRISCLDPKDDVEEHINLLTLEQLTEEGILRAASLSVDDGRYFFNILSDDRRIDTMKIRRRTGINISDSV
jgi:hypothetical protein